MAMCEGNFHLNTQDDIMNAELDRVSGDVRDCGYDADHFTVAISLPISLALREHSVKEYLRFCNC